MACTFPRTVGFEADGTTIAWSPKKHSKQYATFQLPCGKCIECRLAYARGWAIRCVHEAQMHQDNCFVTLTYSDEKLESPKLIYEHFQLFMKKLRKLKNEPIGVFVTGEYGEKTKRPHWHCLLFNYRPSDAVYHRATATGDKCYTSKTLEKIWAKGHVEFGDVTLNSAGYCARYAAKKLVHGLDDEHDYQPISKKSSKHAIGKKWLEKFWPDVFLYGRLVLADGSYAAIPRYYTKWLEKHRPEIWADYVTRTRQKQMEVLNEKQEAIMKKHWEMIWARSARGNYIRALTPNEMRNKITKQTFEQRLQRFLKL